MSIYAKIQVQNDRLLYPKNNDSYLVRIISKFPINMECKLIELQEDLKAGSYILVSTNKLVEKEKELK
jgi:hypothetical protein